MTEVSVVVATCNRAPELAACLGSLLAQTLPPTLVAVVDDAPGEGGTADVVRRFAGAPVLYVEGERRGLAAAHNRGLTRVGSPVVAFTDDDVVADRRWLERLVAPFRDDDRVACVTGRIVPYELDTPAQALLERYAGFDKGAEHRVFELAEPRPADPLFPYAAGSFGSGANMAFARTFLLARGGFDPALGAGTPARGGDDLAAFFEVLRSGHRLIYEPEAVVRHRHAGELAALERQVFGYGVGLTAYLTATIARRPRSIAGAARRAPAGLAHILRGDSAKNARLGAGYPPRLRRLERRGMLLGPFAYARSRRAAGRPA